MTAVNKSDEGKNWTAEWHQLAIIQHLPPVLLPTGIQEE